MVSDGKSEAIRLYRPQPVDVLSKGDCSDLSRRVPDACRTLKTATVERPQPKNLPPRRAQEKTLQPAVEEQKRIIAKYGPEISLEALNDMQVLHRNIQEAVRLFPPLIMLLRYVHKDFTVTTSKGRTFRVPKVRPLVCSHRVRATGRGRKARNRRLSKGPKPYTGQVAVFRSHSRHIVATEV